MKKRTVRELERFVNWLTRSKSPVFYRFYRRENCGKKYQYLVCWVFWENQMHGFSGKFSRRDEVRILKVLCRENAVLVDSDFLPRDAYGDWSNLVHLEVRPQPITQGKRAGQTNWVIVSRLDDGSTSYPYSNYARTVEGAVEMVRDMCAAIAPVVVPRTISWIIDAQKPYTTAEPPTEVSSVPE